MAGVVVGELDNNSGTLEDQFVYTLTIQGDVDGEVKFPKIDGLEARSAGTSQSMSVVNGSMSREVAYQFVLLPSKEGTFTIPSILVKVDGAEIGTVPLELKVAAGAAEENPDIFVERTFTKTTAYVGEAIGVKIKFYNRLKIAGAEPSFKYPASFLEKNAEGQKNYREVVNGEEFDVAELNTVLIPNRDGEFSIDPALITARIAVKRPGRRRGIFDDFLGASELKDKRLRSAPAVLKILPLPTAGRRKDFSGLVGEFKVSGDLAPRSASTGDSLNLSLVIDGLGSVGQMLEPTLPFDSKVAKVYKDKPEYREVIDGENGVASQKTFKYAIVPSKPGQHNLGILNIQTFNPRLGSYQDLQFDLGTIEVAGAPLASTSGPNPTNNNADSASGGKAASESIQKAVEIKAQDLVEPHSQDQLQGSDTLTRQDLTFGGGVLGLSFVAILSSLLIQGRRRPNADSQRIQRANKAFKHSKKHLEFAQACLRKQNVSEALRAAQTCFKDYTGAKFGVVGSAVTLRDMESYLRSCSVSRETLIELREVWSALDQMIYAPPLGQNPSRGEELLVKSRKVLEQMERQCKRS